MVLILSHQGGSFIEKFIDVFDKNNLTYCVLSSQVNNNRKNSLKKLVDNIFFIEKDNLESIDLKDFINTHQNKFKFGCVISVWEGYRELMAEGNETLNAFDIPPLLAKQLRDKLYVRTQVIDTKLSLAKCEQLTLKSIEKRLSTNCKSFIKPRYGLGSVGAKILSGIDDLVYIKDLEKNILNNKLLKYAIKVDDFIIEDYVYGVEHSAEVIVCDDAISILACHYKQQNYTDKTVTEPFSVSPSTIIAGLYDKLNQ